MAAILAWFLSPLGKIVGIGVLIGGVLFWADHNGASRVQEQWDAANAAAKVKADNADTSAAVRADADDKNNLKDEADADKANKEVRDAYIKGLKAGLDHGACTVDDNDINRLRDIR